jgi:hypothetical protein
MSLQLFFLSVFFPITTDRGSISFGSSPNGISNWCNSPLGFEQFLSESATDGFCLLLCISVGFGSISCWMV